MSRGRRKRVHETPLQTERRRAIEARHVERALAEGYDVPKHVLRSPLACDDDPEINRYGDLDFTT